MMVISYVLGQKHYRIPYAWKKLLAYIAIAVVLYGIQLILSKFVVRPLYLSAIGLVLFVLYAAFILKIEKKEFSQMPVIGRFVARI
jgi:uncharacterized membrane protein